MRSEPRPGDFFLYAGSDPVGRLIEFGEWLNGDGFPWRFPRYSHSGVLLDDGTIIEAEPGGARIRPVTEYAADLMVWSSWDLTDDQRAAIVAAARKYEGVPYSFLDYFALAAHRFHLPIPCLRRYIASTKHMICSQLSDQSYLDADLHMFADGRWPGFVDPEQLDLVLRGPLA